MIPVLTVAEMRGIDEKAIGGDSTAGYSYMVRAGMGLLAAAESMMPHTRAGEIAILCGKGNNGGDGYVAGRLLLDAGYNVMCISLCDTDSLRGEVRIALNEYIARKGNVLVLNDAGDLSGLSNYRLIVDAMLGTGLKGDPHGLWATAIEAINASRVPVLAVDTPSGLNPDTGIPGNPCVKATVTVTMGFPKIGFYFHPGKSYVGELIVHDLSYPDDIVYEQKRTTFFPTPFHLKELLPPRHPSGSKFDHGLALLICGSRGYTGSAALVAQAALRSGCGMTHLAIPESVLPIMSTKLTETVLHPLHETNSGTPAFTAVDEIKELMIGKQALCIGPGISHETQTSRLAREVVRIADRPLLLDADGLNAFKDCAGELKLHGGDLVITPHAGEWQRLFGPLPQTPVECIDALSAKACEFQMTILYKGNPTIVVDPDGVSWILPFGNSALAKAGSGDVLSGIIVSLMAQGATTANAALLGGYVLGEAGTIVSRKMGEYSVIAADIIDALYRVFNGLLISGNPGSNDQAAENQNLQ